MLQHADEFMDEEKKEVLVTGEKAGVRLGIWVNLVLKTTRGPVTICAVFHMPAQWVRGGR